MGVLVLNLVLTFGLSSYISVGGPLGGLAGGAVTALAFSRFGRGHALYGRLGAVGIVGAAAVGLGSIAAAEWAAHAATWCFTGF